MTGSGLRPYRHGDLPVPGSVGVSAVVLTRDEAANIDRCLASLAWAAQVIVVDSGSMDGTVELARSAGVDVVVEPWRGYGAQREFALRSPLVRHDWVYFVDADEWVSPELAAEVADALRAPASDAYAQRFRLMFQGRWIRHCGWYGGAWIVRLMRRSTAHFCVDAFGERARVTGGVGRLHNDLVDDDRKGLARWLHKHVGYAELEAARRGGAGPSGESLPVAARWRAFRAGRAADTRPLPRAILKDLVLPAVPARPLAMFCYMYVLRLGFLDGRAGLLFCLYHAWFQLTVDALRAEDRHPVERPLLGQAVLVGEDAR